MKKFFFLLFIIAQIPLFAMPPHPDADGLVNREHRPIERGLMINKSSSSDSTRMMSSPLSTGTVKVLVLLVGYGADQAAFPVMSNKTNPFLFLLLLPLLLPFFFPGKKRLILLSASVFLITVSCPNNTDSTDYGDRMLFQTPASVYDNILQSGSPPTLTMKQYYLDMSNDKLDLEFDIKGPYNAPYGWQYYGKNDSNDYDMYSGELVGFAVDAAEADGVNFSQYDNDGNGSVDTVIVVHAGRGEESGAENETIWSHNWSLSEAAAYGDGDGARTYDGKSISNYTIQPEYTYNQGDSSIGVFCHEFGHVLGLPDLYDTSGQTRGVGSWSLMSGGSWGSGDGSDPAPLLAWERYDIGGDDSWITLTEKDTDPTISIDNIELSKTAYKVSLNPDKSQYLILEGKTQEISGNGWVVPETGILITHINKSIIDLYRNSNSVNSGYDRVHGVNIVEAVSVNYDTEERGSLWNSGYSSTGTMCFRNTTKKSLTNTTIPSSKFHTSEDISSKTGTLDISITEINGSAMPMSFSLVVP